MSAPAIPPGPWLNVGSGPSAPPGWISLDGSWQARLAGRTWLTRVGRLALGIDIGHWPRGVRYQDIRRGLGYPDGSVAVVYASHVIEHLHRGDSVRFLRGVRSALRPGGVCRVVVPDLFAIVGWYLAHRQEPAEHRKESSSDLLMNMLMLCPGTRRPVIACWVSCGGLPTCTSTNGCTTKPVWLRLSKKPALRSQRYARISRATFLGSRLNRWSARIGSAAGQASAWRHARRPCDAS